MLSHAGMSGSRTEFQRIAALARLFGPATAPDVGIGDDAAVLHPSTAVLATVDAAVEGVHFRREFATLDVVSQRAIEAAAQTVFDKSAVDLTLATLAPNAKQNGWELAWLGSEVRVPTPVVRLDHDNASLVATWDNEADDVYDSA